MSPKKPFVIKYGEPEVASFMKELLMKKREGTLSKDELKFAKKLTKCLFSISQDPKRPGLNTHEIDVLSKKYGTKIWQSYMENNTPAAGRVFWMYDLSVRNQIVILGIEPHPNPGSNKKIKLSVSFKDT